MDLSDVLERLEALERRVSVLEGGTAESADAAEPTVLGEGSGLFDGADFDPSDLV